MRYIRRADLWAIVIGCWVVFGALPSKYFSVVLFVVLLMNGFILIGRKFYERSKAQREWRKAAGRE